tara:strand:- start:1177 stop:2877 length:1701 start_codon:yes stop_codon:yes gene_type:complete
VNSFNLELQNLFNEKKYEKVIEKIESLQNKEKRSSGLLNILGVSRVLSFQKDVTILELALENFEEAYLKEKNTQISLDALTNYINLLVQIFDIKNKENNLINLDEKFQNASKMLKNAEEFFGYNHKFFLAIVKFYKKLNNIDKCLLYLQKIFENNNIDKNSLCSYIYYNSFQYGWDQKDFLFKSKELRDHCEDLNEASLVKLNLKKNNKIKIGFLSSDIFNKHSVTYFLKTVIANYNEEKFEIYLYNNNKEEDSSSNDFQNLVNKSFNIYHLSDLDAVNHIREDNVDIIFDLMGITSSNRINLFKNRIAPIQISWLGYCNTTGIDEIDYIVSDNNLIKKNEVDLYSEKIIFLPNIWSCHVGFDLPRIDTPPPYIKNDYVTFGSFNNFNKININVIKTWSNILKKTKNSKLILKSSINIETSHLKKMFNEFGILNSIEFLDKETSFENHLKLYEKVDIALDTFPYNGVTTSFEAIWMGVPVLTMTGFNFNSRCGESINNNIGMNDLIAKNEEDYISKATSLADDKSKLSVTRKKIFNNCLSSPLFNQKKFCFDFFEIMKSIYKEKFY